MNRMPTGWPKSSSSRTRASAEYLLGFTQVGAGVVTTPEPGHQRGGVGRHQRVGVHVDDARAGRGPVGDLVGVGHVRQARAQVEELADALADACSRPSAAAGGGSRRRCRRPAGTPSPGPSRWPRRTPPGRPRSCPCRRAGSSRCGPYWDGGRRSGPRGRVRPLPAVERTFRPCPWRVGEGGAWLAGGLGELQQGVQVAGGLDGGGAGDKDQERDDGQQGQLAARRRGEQRGDPPGHRAGPGQRDGAATGAVPAATGMPVDAERAAARRRAGRAGASRATWPMVLATRRRSPVMAAARSSAHRSTV